MIGRRRMHHLYISLSCSTWYDHGWYRVVVFSTINIAVTAPTSTSSGRTQHCRDNKTVLLPNYYQYWCSIGIPDFRFSRHHPPELKWQLPCSGDTHPSKVSLCGHFSLGVIIGNTTLLVRVRVLICLLLTTHMSPIPWSLRALIVHILRN